jgi:L-gulonolactone oxidase
MGGAIATGAHGSSLIHPTSISEQTVNLSIIDGLGQIRQLSSADSNFNALRVHLGLLGIIIDLTVQTVPLFKMRVENTVQPDEILFNGIALRWAQSFDWYQMWWFPFYNEVKNLGFGSLR